MLQRKSVKEECQYVGYATPNKDAIALLPEDTLMRVIRVRSDGEDEVYDT